MRMGRPESNHDTPLTRRQADTLREVMAFIEEHHRPPVIRELSALIEARSVKTSVDILIALEKKGYVERLPHSSQIKVLRDENKRPLRLAFEVVNG